MFNFVYDTPCQGKITGVIRLGSDGVPEILPGGNLGPGDGQRKPSVPTGMWLPMDTLPSYDTEEEMFQGLNERDGWSVTRS